LKANRADGIVSLSLFVFGSPRARRENMEMNLTKWITLAVALLVAGSGADGESIAGRAVTVFCQSDLAVPVITVMQAERLASEMFGNIGITLHWRAGRPAAQDTDAIAIEFLTGTSRQFMPGSLAYALPYEGVHIRIFWDRVREFPAPPELLAHVMVHEVTHIVEGTASHSEEGIMKAHWTSDDIFAMESKPLKFSPDDVDLIYSGLDIRETGSLSVALSKVRR
jgi:hypothetical protein